MIAKPSAPSVSFSPQLSKQATVSSSHVEEAACRLCATGSGASGSSPPRSYFVGAHVGARDLVGDAVDLGVGESLPQELELGAAGYAITNRNPQDRAVVLS